MAQEKKMNEAFFAKLLKEFNVVGELIRARQDEKQGLLDEFTAESKRFFFGKISEKALASSVLKTNKELARLDSDIRRAISRARVLSDKSRRLTAAQAPIHFRATLAGIVSATQKAKKRKKKRSVKRRKVRRKK